MQELYKPIVINCILSILLIVGIFIYHRYSHKKINLLYLLVLISIIPIFSIFRVGTYEAGDLTLHSVFLQTFYENLQDGLLIPQWAGGLYAGFGGPVFLFEYVMPFYIGSIFHFFGHSFLDSMKFFLAVCFILSGISMYYFLRDDYEEFPAFVGSLLYLFAPIHLMEMHFRVSVGTHVAFIFIPLAFLFAKKALTGNPIYIVLNAVNFLFLILSHSSIAFVIIPASLVYAFLKRKRWQDISFPILSLVLGTGLASYYALPAVFEIKYTWYIETIKYVTDFKPLWEYIFSPVRYGLLFQGNHGEVRLIVGYAQLLIIIVAGILLWKHKINNANRQIVFFLLLFFFTCFILMQSFTKVLWDNIFFLRSFVLPWRMLVPIAFTTAFLGAIIVQYVPRKIVIVFCGFIVLSTILNWGNRTMVSLDPNAYATHWSLYTEYFDARDPVYLKRYHDRVNEIPNLVLQTPSSHLEILSGKGKIRETKRTQIQHEYILDADSTVNLSENTYYFPGWKVFVNGKEIQTSIKNKKRFGTMTFSIKPGLYLIEAKFTETPIRKMGRYISIVSLIIVIVLLFIGVSNRLRKH